MVEELSPIPAHVGIIMDGNGRWATEKGFPRSQGHRQGLEIAKRIVARASDIGISCLSLYTFSTENWQRAESEVSYLMDLIKTHLRKQYDFYRERKIRIVHSGALDQLPRAVGDEISLAEKDTQEAHGMIVNLLINYGGRDEIIRSVKRHFRDGGDVESFNDAALSAGLDYPQGSELDLLIRTGGEMRTSNFLIWQAAYAELFFSDVYWPDWTESHLDAAITAYQSRQRRYGGVEN